MKKSLSLFFVFLLACSALAAITFAAGEDAGISTPDDAFDGNYTEFEGKDGSVTRVFDNGSVSTKSKDGSVTAVDYKGNQYSKDKDGNSTIRTTGGYVATEYKDGRQSLTEPNGKTTTVNPDGSFSESYGVGLTLDYNADGGLTGIGITGDDQRIETDENGNLLEYNDGKNAWNVTYDESGNVVSADITYSDGAKMVKNPDGTASFTLPDGTKYESDGSGNVYQDGEQIKQGGAWIDNSESANAAPDETNTDEPNTEDPPEEPAEAPSGNPLSADRVAGTYHVSGYDAWDDFEDELYNYHDSAVNNAGRYTHGEIRHASPVPYGLRGDSRSRYPLRPEERGLWAGVLPVGQRRVRREVDA